MDIDELHEEIRNISGTIYSAMTRYFNVLSRLAETNRRLNSIKEQKEAAGQLQSSFKDQTTDTFISLRSEISASPRPMATVICVPTTAQASDWQVKKSASLPTVTTAP